MDRRDQPITIDGAAIAFELLFPAVVTWLTERLPIGLIPKQPLIAAMRNSMIHDSRWSCPPLPLTVHAQRM
jgi:hypothetical protein